MKDKIYRQKLEKEIIDNIVYVKKDKKVVRERPSVKVNKYREKNINSDKIIEAMGGNTYVAEFFNVASAAVSYWRKAGIPIQRLHELRLHQLNKEE